MLALDGRKPANARGDEDADASNLVIVSTPLSPAMSARQFASVPIPSDDTSPMPVTTTRLRAGKETTLTSFPRGRPPYFLDLP